VLGPSLVRIVFFADHRHRNILNGSKASEGTTPHAHFCYCADASASDFFPAASATLVKTLFKSSRE